MPANTNTARPDVYSRITDKIIADLEQGVRPWMKPWNADHARRQDYPAAGCDPEFVKDALHGEPQVIL